MKKKYFALPYVVWMSLFIIIPLILIVYYAFIKTNANGGVVFSLSNVGAALSGDNLNILLNSLWLSFLATAICLLVGYPTAYILSHMKPKTAGLMSILFILPMWINFLLRIYAWRALLDDGGIINKLLELLFGMKVAFLNTPMALLFGLVYTFLPFMILPIYNALSKLNRSYIEAAQDLGANRFLVFTKVTLPLSMPGVITGITMVFMPAVTTFVVSRLLGGGKVILYGEVIERYFLEVKDWNFGSALAIVMMVLMIISMFIMRKYDTGEKGGVLF